MRCASFVRSVRRLRSVASVFATALLCVGCAPDLLVGRWRFVEPNPDYEGGAFVHTLVVSADSTAATTLAGAGGGCIGMMGFENLRWSSNGAAVTFSGALNCWGYLACSNGPRSTVYDCAATRARFGLRTDVACAYGFRGTELDLGGCFDAPATTLPRTFHRIPD